jgi:hypothetical protein
MRNALRLLAAAAVLTTSAVAAHADNIVVSMVGPFSPTGRGDSLQYNLQFTTFNAPTTLSQTGMLETVPGSGVYTFSFVDNITIDSIMNAVRFTGQATLTSTGRETLTTSAVGPISFGSLLLNIPATSFSGIGGVPVALTGNITTASVVPPSQVPEPSSIALLGTGILGLAGAARRKFLKA